VVRSSPWYERHRGTVNTGMRYEQQWYTTITVVRTCSTETIVTGTTSITISSTYPHIQTSHCYYYCYYHYYPFNGLLSRTTCVSRYQNGTTSQDLTEVYDGILGCNGISWTTCKQSAPRCRQIRVATPTPHHSIFTGRMLFLTPNQGTEGIIYEHHSGMR